MKSAIPMQVRYHFKKVNEAFSYMHDHAKASLGLKIMEATIQAPSYILDGRACLPCNHGSPKTSREPQTIFIQLSTANFLVTRR